MERRHEAITRALANPALARKLTSALEGAVAAMHRIEVVLAEAASTAPIVAPDGDRLLTLTEAADRLGLAASTLRRQSSKGALRATKRGRDWWVSWAEVERYRLTYLGRPGRAPKPKD